MTAATITFFALWVLFMLAWVFAMRRIDDLKRELGSEKVETEDLRSKALQSLHRTRRRRAAHARMIQEEMDAELNRQIVEENEQ
jgi:hypothetical protein